MADTWTAVIGRLGVPTSDGRVIMPAGFTNRELPLPLSFQKMSDYGHDKSVVVGRIDTITVDPSGMVGATGTWLDPAKIPEVNEARELVDNGVVGPSMDAGGCEVEYVETGGGYGMFDEDGYQEPKPYGEVCVFTAYECAGATLVSIPAFTGVWLRTDGTTPPSSLTAAGVRTAGWDSMPVADGDPEWDGQAAADRVAAWAGVDADDAGDAEWEKYGQAFLWQDPDADPHTKGAYKLGVADVVDGKLEIVPKAVYAVAGVLNGARGGTDIPDADQTRLKGVVTDLYDKLASALDDDTIEAPFSLVASAAPAVPPLAWFSNPQLTGPTPLTVTDDGRVFGHVAVWGVCHIGLPGCVTPPQSAAEYAYFRTGATMTDAGEVPTGKLTVGGGHADGQLGYAATADHYDNVCTSVASVAAGEDDHGIWVAGAILAAATPEQVEALRQSPLSGDWRDIGGNLELVAAHAVNVPGFPVPRPRAVVASSGRQLSLVAAGVPRPVEDPKVAQRREYVRDLAAELTAALGLKTDTPAGSMSLTIPDGFDVDAADLRQAFADAGIAWPTISGTLGGVTIPAFEVAEGCVRGALARARGEQPAVPDMAALAAAQQKLAALRLDMLRGA